MTEDTDQALTVDILVASLALDRQSSGDLLALLTQKFRRGLPRNTQVRRGWLGLGAVQAVAICFEDCQYEISRDRYGTLRAKSIEIVRGIKIKTTEISTTVWTADLAATLARKAAQNSELRDGLTQFIVG